MAAALVAVRWLCTETGQSWEVACPAVTLVTASATSRSILVRLNRWVILVIRMAGPAVREQDPGRDGEGLDAAPLDTARARSLPGRPGKTTLSRPLAEADG